MATSGESAVKKTTDAIQKEQDKVDEKGYYGTEVDSTPDSHYSVEGVLAGKPVPETDSKQAAKVAEENN